MSDAKNSAVNGVENLEKNIGAENQVPENGPSTSTAEKRESRTESSEVTSESEEESTSSSIVETTEEMEGNKRVTNGFPRTKTGKTPIPKAAESTMFRVTIEKSQYLDLQKFLQEKQEEMEKEEEARKNNGNVAEKEKTKPVEMCSFYLDESQFGTFKNVLEHSERLILVEKFEEQMDVETSMGNETEEVQKVTVADICKLRSAMEEKVNFNERKMEKGVSEPLKCKLSERFDVIEKLGFGTYGSVHKAFDRKQGNHVAVKFCMNGNCPSFQRELTISDVLNVNGFDLRRRYIVRFIEFFNDLNTKAIIMELLGANLSEALSSAVFDFRRIKMTAIQIFNGLQFIHDCGIIHGDLKPQNIAFSEYGEIKIIDFGCAIPRKSHPLVTIQTANYRAPEIFLGSRIFDQKIDIWSFGCILVELFTRTPCFGGNEMRILAMHQLYCQPKKSFPSGWYGYSAESISAFQAEMLYLKDFPERCSLSTRVRNTDGAKELNDVHFQRVVVTMRGFLQFYPEDRLELKSILDL